MAAPITLQETKAILMETMQVIESAETRRILHPIHDRSNNDAVMLAQNAFPVITKIQQDVIGRHGFQPNEGGLLEFIHCIRFYQQQDEEVLQMSNVIKSYSLPTLNFQQQHPG